jgi:hypothetical protein
MLVNFSCEVGAHGRSEGKRYVCLSVADYGLKGPCDLTVLMQV